MHPSLYDASIKSQRRGDAIKLATQNHESLSQQTDAPAVVITRHRVHNGCTYKDAQHSKTPASAHIKKPHYRRNKDPLSKETPYRQQLPCLIGPPTDQTHLATEHRYRSLHLPKSLLKDARSEYLPTFTAVRSGVFGSGFL